MEEILDPLRWAKFFASIKHAGKFYASGLPYTHHLASVDAVMVRFGFDSLILRTACWLHDVLEDTETSKKEIAEMFGSEVADIVWAVTNEPGENRAIRHALTYPKIRAHKDALCVKLADRIANVEQGGKLVQMYKKEHENFKRSLYTAGQYEDMWKHLDYLIKGEK